MDILVDRDAVAAGDDMDSHARTFTFADDLAIEDAVEQIVAAGYLPTVAGAATWSVSSGVPISVIADAWPAPRRVAWRAVDPARLARRGAAIGLYFSYHAQLDPALVLEVLTRLRLEPFSR